MDPEGFAAGGVHRYRKRSATPKRNRLGQFIKKRSASKGHKKRSASSHRKKHGKKRSHSRR